MRTLMKAIGAAAVMGLVSVSGAAEPVGETVTYQGVLHDGGSPANGLYDVQFEYYDELGNQVSGPATFFNATIVDGLLNFPLTIPGTFGDGERRFLQVRVRGAGEASFTDLTPREEVTASPYSVYAIRAGEADVAATSLDNEWTRSGNQLSAGSSFDSILINPDLTGGFPINGFTNLQLNFNQFSFGGMYINSVGSGGFPFYGFARDSVIQGFISFNTDTGRMEFTNNFSTGIDLEITGVATEARNLSSKGKIVRDFGSPDTVHDSGPVAYGVVSPLGFKESGTPNFTSSYDQGTNIYTISVDDEVFDFDTHVVMITPVGLASGLQVTYGTFSDGNGNLTVRFYRAGTTNAVSSYFQFVVYDAWPVELE